MANTNSRTTPSPLGQCWSCVSDITSPGYYVSGNRAVAEAIARRLQTPRGGLIDDPDYGFDLTAYVNADISPADIALIQSNVDAECLKDERVAAAVSTVTLLATGVLTVVIQLTAGSGPFTLVLAVSDVTVSLLQPSQ